ncbi:hypothetical protein [Arsenophonus endosymbiont of Aleurodicus floccissimus]|uniref:hypothetical protein n=1 Tax=Arsenophonus endosymbiont of Aleurodicus floccissimus TaxID=2152761 RepID=UPI0011C45C56|nr:hypothetical protein [Arsenophonus endosymbiont of Aleurodicus floccissimus]
MPQMMHLAAKMACKKLSIKGVILLRIANHRPSCYSTNPHFDTETALDSNQKRSHAGINFGIDVTPPELPAKPTVVENKLTHPP